MSNSDHPEENLDYGERSSVADGHHAVRREKDEPQAGREPVSPWATIIGALVLLGGGSYLGAYHGDFDQEIYAQPNYVAEARPQLEGMEVKEALPWNEKWIKDGKKTYGVTCGACHQPNGQGVPGAFPPLAGSEWVTKGTERPVAIILRGLAGPVEVKGQIYNGAMPAQNNLSDKQIAQVMSYIRNAWGNTGSVITEEMVANGRTIHGGSVIPWKASDLPGADINLEGAEVDPLTGEPVQ